MNVEQLIIRGSNPKTSNNTTYYIRISCIIKEMLLRSKIAYRIKWTLDRIGVSTPVFWHRLTKETKLHRQSVESKISTFRLTVWIGVFHRGRTHNKRVEVFMWEIWLRIPSQRTICVLYVIINLIKVKRTSIVVVVALTMLFCVRRNVLGSRGNMF